MRRIVPSWLSAWSLMSLLAVVPGQTASAPREGYVSLWGSYILPPKPVRNVVKIAAGQNFNLALDRDGKVWFWQFNTSGNGDLPASVESGVIDVACLNGFPYALKSDHTIVAWGGASPPPAGLKNVASLPSGAFTYLALQADGTPVEWGMPPWLFPPAGLNNVKALAGGNGSGNFFIAVKQNGAIVTWGNLNGVTPVAPAGLTDLVAVTATGWNEVAYGLRANGTVIAWLPRNALTSNDPGGPFLPAGLTNVTAIAAGLGHGMALKADGTVVSWGGYPSDNSADGGQYRPMADPPAGLTDVVAIAAGHYHCLALKRDGTVVQWGSRSAGGDFAPGDKAVKVAIGWRAVTVLKADGTVTTWGDHAGPAPAGLKDVVDIDMGENAVLALKQDGTVVSWASGIDQVPSGLSGVTAISTAVNDGVVGRFNNLALKSDRSVAAWGWWTDPTPNGFKGALGIATGGIGNQFPNALILDTNGLVHAWGSSWVTPPATLSNVVAVACGAMHGLALKNDGTVASWGTPDVRHQPPVGLNDVIKIRASGHESLAIRGDGTVALWGGVNWASPPPAPPAGLAGVFEGAIGSSLYGVIYSQPDPAELTKFCPLVAETGTEVTIQGASLTSVTNVIFGGVSAGAINHLSDFLITVTVPPNAATGPITVESPYGNATSGAAFVVANGLTPIQAWRVAYFGSPDNAGDAADGADPDHDGKVNLLEYQMNTHPRVADSERSLIARRVFEEAGQRWFEFLVRHYARASDVTLHFETSADLGAGFQPYQGALALVGTESDGSCQTEYRVQRLPIPAGSKELLVRYSVTRP